MDDALTRSVCLMNLATTLFMVGVIWFVQIVHYPLFAQVATSNFSAYEQKHTRLTTRIVVLPMLFEATTALLLLWVPPAGMPIWQLWSGAALLAVTWISTFLVQVPCHKILSQGFDPIAHTRLVWSNWTRTVAWSLRGLLVIIMTWHLVDGPS